MGDRCSMQLWIGGAISTAAQFHEIVEALDSDGACEWDDDAPDVASHLLACAKSREAPEFYFHEVNYANLDCADTIAGLGLDAKAWNDAGYGYPAGWQSWNGRTGEKFQWDEGGEESVSIDILEKALAAPDPVAAVRAAIAQVRADEWQDLRPFAIADSVIRELNELPPLPVGMAHFVAMAGLESVA